MRHIRDFGPIQEDMLDTHLHSWLWKFNRERAGKTHRQIVDDMFLEWI